MGLQFYFLNFGQFGVFFFFFLMSSLEVFGFDLMNMPSFQFCFFWSSRVFNYFLLILFFLRGTGSLNCNLVFSFVFHVKVPTIGFYCDLCFKNNNYFMNFEGFFCFVKIWGSSIFFLSFWRSSISFSFFCVKGGLFRTCEFLVFFVLLFWSFEVFNFFSCHFVGFQKIIMWSFTRGREGYSPFFLWTLKVFCFLYFEFAKFSIFLLVILWAFKNHYVKFCKGERFCGSSKNIVWSFARGRERGIFAFFFCELWKVFFLYFEVSETLNFFLSFWGSSIFFVSSFTSEEMG